MGMLRNLWKMFGKKTVFYNELKGELDTLSAGYLFMCLVDLVDIMIKSMGFLEGMV